MEELQQNTEIELQLTVAGAHLKNEFGFIVQIIENDGFQISSKVKILENEDFPLDISRPIGRGGYQSNFKELGFGSNIDKRIF
jgi:hypothetical protein